MLRWATRSKTSVSWSRSVSTASLLKTMPPPATMSMAAKRCSGVQVLSITPAAPAASRDDLREVPGAVQDDRRLIRVGGEDRDERRTLAVDPLVDEYEAIGMPAASGRASSLVARADDLVALAARSSLIPRANSSLRSATMIGVLSMWRPVLPLRHGRPP